MLETSAAAWNVEAESAGFPSRCQACGHAPTLYHVQTTERAYYFCEVHRADALRRRDPLDPVQA